jgi:hypothetical protein
MRYIIYTTVDITNTGQYKTEPGRETDRWREQNFQTVLQTLGIRTNISFNEKPNVMHVNGSMLGFNTTNIINVWKFSFDSERDYPFGTEDNPVKFLETDFDGVPFISGLDESMEQNYAVFVTDGPARNIIFNKV